VDRKKFVFLIAIMIILMSFSLVACGDPSDGNQNTTQEEPQQEVPQDTEDNSFYSTENIVYNSIYAGEGAGYLRYDTINLSALTYDSSLIDTSAEKYIDVYRNDQKIADLTYRTYSFGYTFTESGTYVFKLVARKKGGGEMHGSFQVDVVNGDRPTGITFAYENQDGEAVVSPVAGSSMTVRATVYAGDAVADPTSYSCHWDKGNTQGCDLTLSYGDSLKSFSDAAYFFVVIPVINNPNGYTLGGQCEYIVQDNLLRTENCPSGIEFSLPSAFVNGEARITALQKITDGICATAHFIGGNSTVLTADTLRHQGGQLGMFIKYNGEGSFALYNPGSFSYTHDASGNRVYAYYQNEEQYYFDHTKQNAEVYFALLIAEFASSNSYETVVIEGAEGSIDFDSCAPEDLRVTQVSGVRRTVNAFTNANDYSNNGAAGGVKGREDYTASVVNGTVTVYISCDMDKDGSITDEYEYHATNYFPQYFELLIDAQEGKAKDYTVTIQNPSQQVLSHYVYYRNYGNLESFVRFFVPVGEGQAIITLTPKSGGTPYQLTVNVINPVVGTKLITTNVHNLYAGALTMESSVKVAEYLYNLNKATSPDYGYRERSLAEGETLKYAYNEVECTSLSFVGMPSTGYDLTVMLYRGDERIASATAQDIYILPNVAYTIGGVEYFLYDAEDTRFSGGNVSELGGGVDYYFSGYLPVATVVVSDVSAVTYESITLSGEGAGGNLYLGYSVSNGERYFFLRYRYTRYTRQYEVAIGRIYIVQQE